MPEPATLAAATVALLSPYFAEAAKQGAAQLGKQAADKVGDLIAWLRAKLSGHEALIDLGHRPENPDRQAALRVQIEKLLEQEPDLLGPLARLVEEARATAPGVSTVQTGDRNIAGTNVGTGNTITIQR
jgi:hypothetical protein